MCCEPAVKISVRSNGRISGKMKFRSALKPPLSKTVFLSLSLRFSARFSPQKNRPASQQLPQKTSIRSQQSPKHMGLPSMGWTLNNLPLQPSSGRPNIKGHQEDIPASLEQNSSLLRGTTFVNISAPFLLV